MVKYKIGPFEHAIRRPLHTCHGQKAACGSLPSKKSQELSKNIKSIDDPLYQLQENESFSHDTHVRFRKFSFATVLFIHAKLYGPRVPKTMPRAHTI